MQNLLSNEVISNQTLKKYVTDVTFVIQPEGGTIKAQNYVNNEWVDIEAYTANTSIDISVRGGAEWRFNITGAGRVDYYYYAE
mgnify:CR=1 FL=1|tara:strand:- start:1104 stop:1352 length:249 start_codon:yes stop_codon:yes gene_type:complete